MGVSSEVFIPGEYKLSGTLTIPDVNGSQYPAVLLVSAVGDSNRDGNAGGLKTDIFLKLANFFTSLGFITLRYDKRGCGKSEGQYKTSGLQDSISDAARALRFLKSYDKVDSNKTIILGHSEGAIVLPAIFQQERASGAIILCGASRPGSELLPLPFRKLANELSSLHSLPGIKGFISRLFQLDKVIMYFYHGYHAKMMAATSPSVRFMGIPCNAAWYRESFEFNASNELKKLDCPTLVIGGTHDAQSEAGYINEIMNLIPGPKESHVIPNMTHILRSSSVMCTMLNSFSIFKQSCREPLNATLEECMQKWVTDMRYVKRI